MMFKTFASAVASTLVASAALVSSGTQAVMISNNDVGQILLGEMYLARPGFSTRVTVVNSDPENAVKAKLTLRSQKHSDECLGVILYLTPGDVAYLDIENGGDKVARVRSNDDSLLSERKDDGTLFFGSQKEFNKLTTKPRTEPALDTCEVGHIEVIAVYAAKDTVTVRTGNPVQVRQGMSKLQLDRIFNTPKADLNTLNAGTCRVTNNDQSGAVVCDGADFNNRVRLLGNVEMKMAGGPRILTNMVALASGGNPHTVRNGVMEVTHTVTHSRYDVFVMGEQETGLGVGMGLPTDAGIVNVTDKLWDIEGALKTTRLFNTYTKGQSNFQVTFPTRYRHIKFGRNSGSGATYTPPFHDNGAVVYAASLDTSENSAPAQASDVCSISPCPTVADVVTALIHEVNYETLNGTGQWDQPFGWFRLQFVAKEGVDDAGTGKFWTVADGVPAIGFAHYYQANLNNSVALRLGR